MNFKKLVASVAMTASAALIATGVQAETKVDPKLPHLMEYFHNFSFLGFLPILV